MATKGDLLRAAKRKLDAYEELLHLKNPSGALTLMCPGFISLWLASDGKPTVAWIVIVFMTTIMSFASASCLGEWANARRRGENPAGYDKLPALVDGTINSWEAFTIGCLCYLTGMAFMATSGSTMGLIAQAAAAGLMAFYVLLRHVLMLPYLLLSTLLGSLYSVGIPIVYGMVNDRISWVAWAYMGINLFWTAACELQETIRFRLPMTGDSKPASRETEPNAENYDSPIMVFCYSFFFVGMGLLGLQYGLGLAYWVGYTLALLTAIVYSLKVRYVRPNERRTAGFAGQPIVGIVLWLGVVADFALRLQAFPRF